MLYCDTANPGAVVIGHSYFSQNEAILGPGGVAVIYEIGSASSRYTFVNCTFEGNKAAQVGGAMALRGVRNMNISHCAFIGNSVAPTEQGSSIYMAQGSSPFIVRYALGFYYIYILVQFTHRTRAAVPTLVVIMPRLCLQQR